MSEREYRKPTNKIFSDKYENNLTCFLIVQNRQELPVDLQRNGMEYVLSLYITSFQNGMKKRCRHILRYNLTKFISCMSEIFISARLMYFKIHMTQNVGSNDSISSIFV